MEGGRYFRTGAYEKEKYFIESFRSLLDKCEKNVMRF